MTRWIDWVLAEDEKVKKKIEQETIDDERHTTRNSKEKSQ